MCEASVIPPSSVCALSLDTKIIGLTPAPSAASILTSTGSGNDVMIPMAIPSFGGTAIKVITMLVVPVLYCWRQERKIRKGTLLESTVKLRV